jgi:hypothetical protein
VARVGRREQHLRDAPDRRRSRPAAVVLPRDLQLPRNKIDGIAAILNQSQPSKNWYATKDDDESGAAADVAELADPVLLDEIDYPHTCGRG